MTNKRTHLLGQHMLVDSETLNYEVAMARPEGKTVLEIGGGTGNLTSSLLEKAKKVITVEIDPQKAEELNERFIGEKKLKIIESDFLSIPKDKYKADIIVGNIPYSASSPILFKLREWSFEHAVLCVQKEFADRMVAKPGDRNYSRLSVMSQIYFTPRYLKTVSAGCFRPIPEVDSAIVILFPKKEKILEKRDESITKIFIHRKKILAAAIKSRDFTDTERARLSSTAEQLGILKKRIFHISPEEILKLLKD